MADMSAKKMPAASKLAKWRAMSERDARAAELAAKEGISFSDAVLKILEAEQNDLFGRKADG